MVNASAAGAVTVMMPVYNEEPTLEVILNHVLSRPEVGQVIAVDDGSGDRSREILTQIAAGDSRVEVIHHPRNLGKGAALRHAIEAIACPYALVQDADLEYDPRDYEDLLKPLIEGRADVVYGVRGFASHSSYSFWFVAGNKGVTLALNLLFDCYISDMETGYKVMRSDLWRQLQLAGDRFDVEPQITTRVLRLGYRIHEVPIRYYARGRDEGKKLTWMDGVRALGTLFSMRLRSEDALFGTVDREYHRRRQEELDRHHPLRVEPAGPSTGSDE